jgi:CubicO group peptidase (beta-lactamase class C family)
MISSRRVFLQQLGLGVGAFALLPPGRRSALAASGTGLPRSTPEAEGIASSGILAFLEAVAQSTHELHSFMMLRHGRVIAEGWWAPYSPELRHTMYSMSKSFTSTAVGFAVAEGRLRIDDRVVSFFPKELPAQVGENLAALRVKDLLTMSVGNEKEPTGTMIREENWVRAFLAQPITHPPGSLFMYNSAATYMCSAIVQQVVGEKVLDYLRPRLFEPLGVDGMTWETCPRGINTGGWGLSIRTEGLAKFGQLYLQKGEWQGRQLLPASWVNEATTFKIQQPDPAKPTRPKERNDWLQGYGYQFWRCQHRGFRGDGAFGQYTIVLPEQDVVIAMTGESKNMQGELDLIWEHLLPAVKGAPLPADPATQARLRRTLSALALAIPKGQPTSPTAGLVSGKTFQLDVNDLGIETATFAFGKESCTATLRAGGNAHAISCGNERWQRGMTSRPGTPPRLIAGGAPPTGTAHPLVASGTWKDEGTFEMTWRFYETPHHDTVTCRFDGNGVEISFLNSIARMNGKSGDGRPVLHGKLAG